MGPEAQYRPGDPELLDNYCRAAIAADRLRDLPSIVALGVPEDVATPGLAAASRIVARFNTLGPTAKVDPSDFEVLRKLDLILDRVEPNH
jgi:hypothetical protein